MKRGQVVIVLLSVLSVIGWQSTAVRAQTEKTARGTVTAISADSMTVKVGDHDMKFAVDGQTKVIAPGASTKSKAAAASGSAGIKITDVVSVGKAVEVKYAESGGSMHAASVRAISSPGAGGGSVSEKTPSKTASGTVKSIGGTALTITSGGKDMTFAVDASTHVVAKGAGTKAAAGGGTAAITDLVGSGDQVSVTYSDMGGTMHASSVRVTTKAAK
jgi:hypothetical protein